MFTQENPAKVRVLVDDDVFAIISKPQGLSSTGPESIQKLDDICALNCSHSILDALTKPQPVHRLDKETGGLLVLGKTKSAVAKLSELFRDHKVTKTYRALVRGKLEGKGSVDAPIEGKPTLTKYESIQCDAHPTFQWVSTVELFPITGRTHQLRRHMALLGHPILGDIRYGSPHSIYYFPHNGKYTGLTSSPTGIFNDEDCPSKDEVKRVAVDDGDGDGDAGDGGDVVMNAEQEAKGKGKGRHGGNGDISVDSGLDQQEHQQQQCGKRRRLNDGHHKDTSIDTTVTAHTIAASAATATNVQDSTTSTLIPTISCSTHVVTEKQWYIAEAVDGKEDSMMLWCVGIKFPHPFNATQIVQARLDEPPVFARIRMTGALQVQTDPPHDKGNTTNKINTHNNGDSLC